MLRPDLPNFQPSPAATSTSSKSSRTTGKNKGASFHHSPSQTPSPVHSSQQDQSHATTHPAVACRKPFDGHDHTVKKKPPLFLRNLHRHNHRQLHRQRHHIKRPRRNALPRCHIPSERVLKFQPRAGATAQVQANDEQNQSANKFRFHGEPCPTPAQTPHRSSAYSHRPHHTLHCPLPTAYCPPLTTFPSSSALTSKSTTPRSSGHHTSSVVPFTHSSSFSPAMSICALGCTNRKPAGRLWLRW